MAERWFDRRFELGLDATALPRIVERLRSAPGRLETLLGELTPERLIIKPNENWSVQENAGHLLDLEPLWYGRLADLLAGAEDLRPADLTNLKTHKAEHNDQVTQALLTDFRAARERLVARLECLSADDLGATAFHPRLRQPMSVADLFYFVAEHDDHHLARIRELIANG